MVRKIVLLLFLALVGCGELLFDSSKDPAGMTAQMVVTTTVNNSDSPTHNMVLTFLSDDGATNIEKVTVDNDELSYDSNKSHYFHNFSSAPRENQIITVVCEFSKGVIDSSEQTLSGTTLTIQQMPSFQLKVADTVSELENVESQEMVDGISSSQVIMINLGNYKGYTVKGVATLVGDNGQEDTADIGDGWYIPSTFLKGNASGFPPNQIILDVVFSYDGTLDDAFGDGYIRREIRIKKSINITQ
ncbi:MAG: hypothetical protein ACO3K7_00285 [Candidatus Marinamargulisbacteria bacterium]